MVLRAAGSVFEHDWRFRRAEAAALALVAVVVRVLTRQLATAVLVHQTKWRAHILCEIVQRTCTCTRVHCSVVYYSFLLTDGTVVLSATRVILQVDGSVWRTEAAGRAAVRITLRVQSVARLHASARLVHVISRTLVAVVCAAVVHDTAVAGAEADGRAA